MVPPDELLEHQVLVLRVSDLPQPLPGICCQGPALRVEGRRRLREGIGDRGHQVWAHPLMGGTAIEAISAEHLVQVQVIRPARDIRPLRVPIWWSRGW